MRPATLPPDVRDAVRLLRVDSSTGETTDHRLHDLAALLEPGDLVVLNDAATLPASLIGQDDRGRPIEVRLVGPLDQRHWRVVCFGAGDWRTKTEDRPPPPALRAGQVLRFGSLTATVRGFESLSSRLVTLRFDREGAELWQALYANGRPIQYAYLQSDLQLWSVQTVYAARPWSVEMPSAGRPLSWRVLLDLRRRGIELATLTHAAGLSATGDPRIDEALPLPERYEIPDETVEAVERTTERGGRVIAVGTTVVRALEDAAGPDGILISGPGRAELRIDRAHRRRVVDGLLTGMHEPTESHFSLLEAFAPRRVLDAALVHAIAAGYRTHEFGDLSLYL